MTTKVTMDRAGRVVIPRAIREELDLSPGADLQLESEGDQMILRPVVIRPALEKERGFWVYRTGERLRASVAQETLRKVRERRGRRGLGRAE